MIFETLVLGSVLYIGYQELKNGFNKDKSLVVNPAKKAKGKEITPIFEMNRQLNNNNNPTYQQKNQHEILSAAIALTLSSAGLYYRFMGPLSLPFILYASKDIYQATFSHSQQGKITLQTLMTLTIIGILLTGRFFIASVVVFLIKLALQATGKLAESSQNKRLEIFQQQINFVWVIVDGVEVRIPIHDLQVGDIVMARTGDMIPADGTVIKGQANVHQYILTGEENLIEINTGDQVLAAMMMLTGQIHFKVKKLAQETRIAQMADFLNHTVDSKSPPPWRAEMFSEHFVKSVIIAGGLALPILGVNSALAVLNAHPKNHLMLLAPISIMNYLNLASQQGILIEDGHCLELLTQVDMIVIDQSAILTNEQFHVTAIHCCSYYSEHQILTYAAAAEDEQTHPIAIAIVQEAVSRQLNRPALEKNKYNRESKINDGLIAKIAGKTIHLGRYSFIEAENIFIPENIKQQQQFSDEQGATLILVAINKKLIGAIELLPSVRLEVQKVISQLKQRPHIKSIYLISEDREISTKKLAQTLDIDCYFAETLPENKAEIIEQLQQQGHLVCYISNNIHDSMALKKSFVSISLHDAAGIATHATPIIFITQDLTPLNFLFEIADDFNAHINTTYDILLIPTMIGIGGVFLFGFGVSQTLALNIAGLTLGLGNTLRPLLKPPTNQNEL